MVRRALVLATLASIAGCSPGLWVDDGYYMCVSGSCPSIAPYCWRDLHCHAAQESTDGGAPDSGEIDAGPIDAGDVPDANGLPPTFVACSATLPCARPGEFCTPLHVCSRTCAADAECRVGQCSPNELPSRPAYCRPPCDAGCPSNAICGLTRSVSGTIADAGTCIAPLEMFATARHYENCDSDAMCGPYTCTGRVSASQPGICLLPCELDGLGCPSGMACVQTAGGTMPTACLFTCTALTENDDCIPQGSSAPRCESRMAALGPRLVCIDADGL